MGNEGWAAKGREEKRKKEENGWSYRKDKTVAGSCCQGVATKTKETNWTRKGKREK